MQLIANAESENQLGINLDLFSIYLNVSTSFVPLKLADALLPCVSQHWLPNRNCSMFSWTKILPFISIRWNIRYLLLWYKISTTHLLIISNVAVRHWKMLCQPASQIIMPKVVKNMDSSATLAQLYLISRLPRPFKKLVCIVPRCFEISLILTCLQFFHSAQNWLYIKCILQVFDLV